MAYNTVAITTTIEPATKNMSTWKANEAMQADTTPPITIEMDVAKPWDAMEREWEDVHESPPHARQREQQDQQMQAKTEKYGTGFWSGRRTLRILSAYLTTTATVRPPKATRKITVQAMGE